VTSKPKRVGYHCFRCLLTENVINDKRSVGRKNKLRATVCTRLFYKLQHLQILYLFRDQFHARFTSSFSTWSRKCKKKRLTTWVNFINVLRECFLYESLLSSFYLLRVWLWTNFRTKIVLVKCWWNWALLGTVRVKALRKHLHKINPSSITSK